jgi:D-lactate dehydrogenase
VKIAFFEIEEWEKPYLQDKLSGHELIFSENPLTEETVEEAKDAEILSVFIYSEVKKEIIDHFPHLKMVTTRSTGWDHIDVNYCKEKNIAVCTVPEYGTHTVAEHTFALLLALSRRLLPSLERAKKGDFNLDGLRGFDLHHKTLGVVGVGNIGTSIIQIANGFGMDVLAFARKPDMALAQKLGFMYVDMDHLLATSDVITLHVPLTPETKHMINKDNITKLKKGAILLNTARGGLIETEAIVMGLEQGILRGVGVDVLEEEIMIKEERELLSKHFLDKADDVKTQLLNHVLLDRDEVLVTPHNAFNSNEALQRILDVTVENVSSFVSGTPKNVVEQH